MHESENKTSCTMTIVVNVVKQIMIAEIEIISNLMMVKILMKIIAVKTRNDISSEILEGDQAKCRQF